MNSQTLEPPESQTDPVQVRWEREADPGRDESHRQLEPELAWSGVITWRETAGLREALFNRLETRTSTDVRLDVRAVTSIDTTGVAVLIGANHRAAATGRRLVLVDSNGPVTAGLTKMHLRGLFHLTQVITSTETATGET